MEKPDIEAENLYAAILAGAEYVLEKEGCTTPERTLRGPELREKVREEFPLLLDVNNNTFAVYLSRASKDTDANLNTLGRWQGYFLRELSQARGEIEEEEERLEASVATEPERDKERKLYPALAAWLQEQGYRTRDVSTLKGGGKWGNPDVAGLKIEQFFEEFSLEV